MALSKESGESNIGPSGIPEERGVSQTQIYWAKYCEGVIITVEIIRNKLIFGMVLLPTPFCLIDLRKLLVIEACPMAREDRYRNL